MRDELGRLQEQVDAARTREEKLRKALIEAESERDASILARRDLLVRGDLNDTKAHTVADRRVGDAERKICALTDAIAVTTEQRAGAERDLGEGRNRVARENEASRARDAAEKIHMALRGFEQAALPLIAALHHAENFHGHQLGRHLKNVIVDLKEAPVTGIMALTQDLKLYAADLLAGRTKIQKKIALEEV